ncbi:hypothetical protein PR001_g28011, partial [Phytophthora rubi]
WPPLRRSLAFIFTRSRLASLRYVPATLWAVVAGELECGMVAVNSELVTHVGAPFGGIKESGIGREGSSEGLQAYQETKMVCLGGLE